MDRRRRLELAAKNFSVGSLAARSDRSPGVLCASGYIAGGAIAGIVIAILAGGMEQVEAYFSNVANSNPFHSGPNADALAMIPFIALVVFLYLVGREKILRGKNASSFLNLRIHVPKDFRGMSRLCRQVPCRERALDGAFSRFGDFT